MLDLFLSFINMLVCSPFFPFLFSSIPVQNGVASGTGSSGLNTLLISPLSFPHKPPLSIFGCSLLFSLDCILLGLLPRHISFQLLLGKRDIAAPSCCHGKGECLGGEGTAAPIVTGVCVAVGGAATIFSFHTVYMVGC